MYAFRNVVAESFAAVLHTTVADPYKDGEMWRLLLDTASVDGVLNSTPPMDKIIHEMILAWNHADTWQKRIQILSMYSTRLSFSQLKGYNHPSVSPNQTGERAAVLDQDADGDGAEDDEDEDEYEDDDDGDDDYDDVGDDDDDSE